jgi:flagellar M-ring protein FliF
MALDATALRERVRRLSGVFTPGQLVIIALLGVLALVGTLAFVRWSSAPSYGVLFSGLDPKDASSVVEKLRADGVPYKLANDGTTVLVPAAKVYTTRLALSAAGLPRGGVVGYELLDKQSLTTSDFRQQIDYQRALEGELSRTLTAVEGVESATVHLAIPKERLFSDDQQPARASVLLRTSGPLPEDSVQGIVHLVASSVPGLTPENVTVADTSGQVLSTNTSPGGISGRELRLTQQYENQLAAKASSMLAQAFGPGRAVVRVSAQLNFDERERESESYDPANQVTLREKTTTEVFKGNGQPPGGTVGVAGGVTATGSTATDYNKSEAARDVGVSRVVEKSKVAPGKVERLSVAVILDGSAKPVPPEETVREAVSAALGLDTTRGDTISVDTVRFDGTIAKATEQARKAEAAKASTGRMMGLLRTVVGALVLLAVVLALILGSRTKVTPVEVPEVGPGSLAAAIAAARGPAGALAAPQADGGLGGTLAPVVAATPGEAEILNLIDQQPEEVATLLRSWLADRRA